MYNSIFGTANRLRNALDRRTPQSSTNDLVPYAIQAQDEQNQQNNLFQPIKVLLDILQRPQYLVANIADEIQQSLYNHTSLSKSTMDVLEAAWKGITGERKGDWQSLLFGGEIEGDGERPGWLPENLKNGADQPLIKWGAEGSTGLAQGIARPSNIIGFLANVLLDPLTYLSFGATSAAKAAATRYADDVLKLTLANMPIEQLASKFGEKAVKKAGEKMEEYLPRLLNQVRGKGDKAAQRFLETTYNDAFKFALKNPQKALMENIEPHLSQLRQSVDEGRAGQGIQDLIASIGTGDVYASAGERGARFMQKEFGRSIRQPNAIARGVDRVKEMIAASPTGRKVGDAWWSVMNNGPIGAIRNALGIRNPYEQALRIKELNTASYGDRLVYDNTALIKQVFSGYDEDTLAKARDLRMAAESFSARQGNITTVYNWINDPQEMAKWDISPEQAEKIKGLWQNMDGVLNTWKRNLEAPDIPNWSGDFEERINYIPANQNLGEFYKTMGKGNGVTGFAKKKSMTMQEHIDQAVATWKWLGGDDIKAAAQAAGMDLDEYVKNFVVKNDLAGPTLDLENAFLLRAIGQAKSETRLNQIRMFRQYGVSKADLMDRYPELAPKLMAYPSDLPQLGLFHVSGTQYEDLLFDKNTADILNRVNAVSGSDEVTKRFTQVMASFTNWWKGMVTLSTGFHIRNWMSNNITGFLKHGPQWFNLKRTFGSVSAGVAYAMDPAKYVDLLKNTLDVTDGWIARNLEKRIGSFSVRELADFALANGVIGKKTQLALEGVGEKAATLGQKISPMSNKNLAFQASRRVGDVVENTARFQSFLIDYENMVRQGIGSDAKSLAERLAKEKQNLDYAATEAKKWFIDYNDLTEFERKRLKPFIPFYSWLRHNIANQISGLALYPGMYAITPKARKALSDDENFDYTLMPDYMANLNFYPVGKTASGSNIMFNPNFPIQDINRIPFLFEGGKLSGITFAPQEILDDIIGAAHPLLKTLIETVSGRQVWERKEIQPQERASDLFQYMTNAPQVVQFFDGLMRIAGFKQGLTIQSGPDGKTVMIDGMVKRFLENNIPVLKTTEQLIGIPEVITERILPQFESWLEKTTGKLDYYKGLEEIFQLVSKWGGIKFKEFSEEQARQQQSLQLLSRAEQLRTKARSQTLETQQRRERTLRSRAQRAARLGLNG